MCSSDNYDFFSRIVKVKVWLLLGWLLLIINLNKTPLGETGCLSNPYFLLTGCSGIQFFDSPPLIQHLCDLQDAMPLAFALHVIGIASHPTLT